MHSVFHRLCFRLLHLRAPFIYKSQKVYNNNNKSEKTTLYFTFEFVKLCKFIANIMMHGMVIQHSFIKSDIYDKLNKSFSTLFCSFIVYIVSVLLYNASIGVIYFKSMPVDPASFNEPKPDIMLITMYVCKKIYVNN